ncbi:MAG: M29 family metallopeptidase [Planctomycetota bacterium]|jgi:leucyl aminopeptidase (aminopeptidase T)
MIEQTADGHVLVDGYEFPPFDLVRLLRTVFELERGESFGVFTDLPDPREVVGFAFLEKEGYGPQKHAYHTVYRALLEARAELDLEEVAFYGYTETGGSNLDLPDEVVTPDGEEIALRDVLARHTIVLYMGTYSATAPITALAKEMGFRGATMHGTNEVVLASGLAVDYEKVSARAERLREALTRADSMRMEWDVKGRRIALDVHLGRQEAQKSHGLVRTRGDIANLPAGEVYYVPTGADGLMPMKFEDEAGTIAVLTVQDRGITGMEQLVQGDEQVVRRFLDMVAFDPNAGQITELGLGTQSLPWAHTDIQDEKIVGTAHLATGRSDHLGGDIGSAEFKDKRNAFHNDVLYTPVKTPEIDLVRVTMRREGEETVVLEDYTPSPFVQALL